MNRKKAAQCLAEGRKNEAREYFQRCIECTPKMALEVIKVTLPNNNSSLNIIFYILRHYTILVLMF